MQQARLKVAIIPHPQNSFPPKSGSVAGVAWENARHLASRCEVTIFSRREPNQPALARVEGVFIRRLAVDFDEKIVARIVRRLQYSFGLEKYALYRFYLYLGFISKTALAIRRLGGQIIHLHNFTQFVPIIRFFNPTGKIILHMHCHWLVEMNEKILGRRLRGVDLIISPSDSITEQTRRRFPGAAKKCVTVPNGVDTQLFSKRNGKLIQDFRQARGLQGKNLILFVGRITPEKGVHVLFEAMARVRKIFPEVVVVVAGVESHSPISARTKTDELYRQFEKMKKNYRAYLDELIAKHDLDVIFAGYQSHETLVNFYAMATVVVFPSFEEAGPLPILEAMSCQTPVVATAVDGIKDYLSEQAGFLVPPNDPEALAEYLLVCLNEKNLRDWMGRCGRHWVETKFTWDHMADRLFAVYNDLASASKLQEAEYEPAYAA